MKSGFKNEKIKQAYEQIPEDLKDTLSEQSNEYRRRKKSLWYKFIGADVFFFALVIVTVSIGDLSLLWLMFIIVSLFVYNYFYEKMVNTFQDKWEKALNAPPYLDFLHMAEMHERWLKRKQ